MDKFDWARVLCGRRFAHWYLYTMEKGMATHTNILAWRIPWIEKPDGLHFMWSQRIGHDWAHTHTHTHTHTQSSVQFSCLVVSDSFQSHGLQHARPPCPSPAPGVYSNSCPLSQWCHPTISSSVVLFSSRLQSFPASGSFPMSQFFKSGGQRIGVSASASVPPKNNQDWFPLGWAGWLSLLSKGLSRVFSNTTVQKSIKSSVPSYLYSPTLTSSIYKTYSHRAFILRKFLHPPFSSGVHFYTLSINLVYTFKNRWGIVTIFFSPN